MSAGGPRRWPADGPPRRPSRRCSDSASAASVGATSRSSGCPRGSRRSGSMGAPRTVPSSSAWSGWPSRSPTNPTTRSRSPSASARLAAGTFSRSTSKSGSTSASGGSLPGSSGSDRPPSPAVPRRSPRMLRLRATRSRSVPERAPVGFGRRDSAVGGPATPASVPFPSGATKLDDDLVASLIPERSARGHKASFGKLLVIAGSLDYAGAAMLVCRAAGRTGVGLVTLAVPESLQPLFAAKVIEATTMALPEDDVEEIDPEPALARILDHEHDAIVVGPGLRPGLATTDLVRSLLTPSEADSAPLVLDAEALRSMATIDDWWEGDRRPAVLTPHAGEFARLRAGSGDGSSHDDGDVSDDDEARLPAAVDAASTWGSVVVLKGARTIIAAPDGAAAI